VGRVDSLVNLVGFLNWP